MLTTFSIPATSITTEAPATDIGKRFLFDRFLFGMVEKIRLVAACYPNNTVVIQVDLGPNHFPGLNRVLFWTYIIFKYSDLST